MSTVYDAIDFKYTYNGDYVPSNDGDFDDTAIDQIQSLVQEIQTVSNSSLGDWAGNERYAASLNDFVGYVNNRDTAKLITDRLRTALITNNVVLNGDLSIKVVPVDRYKVLIVVGVKAAPTINNSLTNNSLAVVSVVYDYAEQGVVSITIDND